MLKIAGNWGKFFWKNLFCLISWFNKLELISFNLTVIEFDSFLYDDILYLHIIQTLLDKVNDAKRIIIFYRKLDFNKLNLTLLLKKIRSKKLHELNYIHRQKKKNNISIFL